MNTQSTPVTTDQLTAALPPLRYLPEDKALTESYLAEAQRRREEILDYPDMTPYEASPRGRCFYVSNDGDDKNDGLTPESPWREIAEHTPDFQGNSKNEVKPGDAVLFRRGDVWYSYKPTNFSGPYSINFAPGVTYAAYGDPSKPKPLFCNAQFVSGADKWEKTATENVWRFTGDGRDALSDIGNIVFDGGKAWGIKVLPHDVKNTGDGTVMTVGCGMVNCGIECYDSASVPFTRESSLRHNLEFWHDWENRALYLYFDRGNPGEYFGEIIISHRGNALRGDAHDVRLRNLAIEYIGSHGIGGADFINFSMFGCEIGWIGGSVQGTDSTVRYGNAVENWDNCSGYTVRYCHVFQCYDAGLTTQVGGHREGMCVMRNVDYSHNVLELCNSPTEIWNTPSNSRGEYMGLCEHIRICDNIMLYSGFHFGHQRPAKNASFFYAGNGNGQQLRDFEFADNIFLYSTHTAYYARPIVRYPDGNGPVMYRNVYLLDRNRCGYVRYVSDIVSDSGNAKTVHPYNEETLGIISSFGNERGSTFYYYDGELYQEEKDGVYRR